MIVVARASGNGGNGKVKRKTGTERAEIRKWLSKHSAINSDTYFRCGRGERIRWLLSKML